MLFLKFIQIALISSGNLNERFGVMEYWSDGVMFSKYSTLNKGARRKAHGKQQGF
jgi:hypothetical protein